MLRVKEAYRGGLDERAGWWMTFHFEPTWELDLADLKRTIPAGDRSYDDVQKRWWVSDAHVRTASYIVRGLEAFLDQKAMF
jgi:hypothetical protein